MKKGAPLGGPLMPFLFIIMEEALGRSVMEATRCGRIDGIKPIKELPPISYQQFLDDTLISTRSSIP